MPTRTQSDITTVGQGLATYELERLWEDLAEDRLAEDRLAEDRLAEDRLAEDRLAEDPVDGDRPFYKRSAARAKPIRKRAEVCRAVEFDAARDSPGEARRKVIMALRGRGCGDVLIQDAAVVVTELAANAVVHASSSFSVSVSLRDSTLRVDVADSRPIAAGQDGKNWVPRQGHGLGLIDAICVRWGTDITAEGKVVWGELQLESERDLDEA
jgi:anti-sigma regulatory factor (Ser/Thr protein kinase)